MSDGINPGFDEKSIANVLPLAALLQDDAICKSMVFKWT